MTECAPSAECVSSGCLAQIDVGNNFSIKQEAHIAGRADPAVSSLIKKWQLKTVAHISLRKIHRKKNGNLNFAAEAL